jgi:hypothetical protein
MQALPIRPRRNTLYLLKKSYKIIHIAKAAIHAHLPYAVFILCKQLLRKLYTFVVNVFKRGNTKLFFKPGKKSITA